MPTRRAASIACMLTASLVIACGSPSSEPARTEQAPKQAQEVLELGDRTLVIEDPGQAPRRRLIHAGTHQRKMQIALSQRKGEAREEDLPTSFVLRLDWRGQTPSEGPAIHEFAIETVEHPRLADTKKPADPEIEAALAPIKDAYSRVRGSIHIEDGRPLRITTTRGVLQLRPDPSLLLELFLVPLPEVEVGVGARWVVTEGKERREYVLTKLDETGATIELERGAVESLLGDLPLARGRFELRATESPDRSKLELADPLPTRGELEFEVVFEKFREAGEPPVVIYQVFELDTAP